MRQLLIVMFKEIKDNLRDRRTFFFALVYGPIMMPILTMVPMIVGVKTSMVDYDATTELNVVGAELAPNLIQHLRNHNLEAIPAPENYRAKIKERELHVVLEITRDFGERLREGKRAPLVLYVNQSSKKSQSAAAQVRNILEVYNSVIGNLRLQARGLDADLQSVIHLQERDLSSEGISGLIFGFFVYFILVFSMMTGGFYLAVDSTAGERERNSLEPLLSLPISRTDILLGKWLAILLFVILSSTLSAFFMYLVLAFVPSGEVSEVFQIGGLSLFTSYLIALPCGILVSAILVAVAAFTRSTKEAQTYISLLYLVPMAPAIAGQFLDIKSTLALFAVPFLSHYQLINKIVKNETVSVDQIIVSAVGALLVSVLMLLVALRLYKRDQILSQS